MANEVSWLQVVTNPTGLAAFVLAVVFGVAAKVRSSPRERYFALGLAGLAVVSGLLLTQPWYSVSPSTASKPTFTNRSVAPDVSQSSAGATSPNVANTGGNVTIITVPTKEQ